MILLLEILIDGEVLEIAIPVTFPPAPVELSPVIVLLDIANEVAVLTVDPILTPVIAPWFVIELMVLFESEETPFK